MTSSIDHKCSVDFSWDSMKMFAHCVKADINRRRQADALLGVRLYAWDMVKTTDGGKPIQMRSLGQTQFKSIIPRQCAAGRTHENCERRVKSKFNPTFQAGEHVSVEFHPLSDNKWPTCVFSRGCTAVSTPVDESPSTSQNTSWPHGLSLRLIQTLQLSQVLSFFQPILATYKKTDLIPYS